MHFVPSELLGVAPGAAWPPPALAVMPPSPPVLAHDSSYAACKFETKPSGSWLTKSMAAAMYDSSIPLQMLDRSTSRGVENA